MREAAAWSAVRVAVAMIFAGVWLIAKFHWLLYVFGLFLLVTGVKMWWFAEEKPDLTNNPVVRWMRGHMKINGELRGERFSLLKYGLALVHIFVGIKMMLIDIFKIPVPVSAGMVATIIATSVVLSLRKTRNAR